MSSSHHQQNSGELPGDSSDRCFPSTLDSRLGPYPVVLLGCDSTLRVATCLETFWSWEDVLLKGLLGHCSDPCNEHPLTPTTLMQAQKQQHQLVIPGACMAASQNPLFLFLSKSAQALRYSNGKPTDEVPSELVRNGHTPHTSAFLSRDSHS